MRKDALKMEGDMRFSIVSISFLVIVLCLTHIICYTDCPSAVPDRYAHVKPGNVVAAYFASWDKYGSYKVSDIGPIAHKLTHIMYAFAKPDAQTGRCDLLDPWADVGANSEHRRKVGGHFGQLLQLKKQHPHLKIVLSIGGGVHSKQLIEIIRRGQAKKFVESAIELLDRYDYDFNHSRDGDFKNHVFEYLDLFDGIDLDVEWPGTSIEKDLVTAYHDMVELFSKALKKRSKKMGKRSVLTCAIQVHPRLIQSLSLGSVSKYVDWFNVMAYDYGGAHSFGVSLNAPICNQWSGLSIDGSINVLIETGVSPEKLVLGIPLYGHVFDKAAEKIGSSFEKTEKTTSLRYEQIKNLYLENPDCKKKWHKVSQSPYVYCPLDQIFVTYDDEKSVQAKAHYAKQKLLQGIVFWRLSGDDKNHSLIRAA